MRRSVSAPGIAAHVPVKPQALGPQAVRHLLQGTLFVGGEPSEGGVQWHPFHFTHHQSGQLALQPLGDEIGAVKKEFFLNANWKQPFVAAPCRPILAPAPSWGKPEVAERQLYPFTLSYAPVQDPSDKHANAPARRTLLLAATEAKTRARWLETFSQKAHAPELRHAGVAPTRRGLPRSLSNLLATDSGLEKALLPHQQLVTLGQEHCGLPALASEDGGASSSGGWRREAAASAANLRLSAGRAELWEGRSRYSIVRDLYDGYAADPLGTEPTGRPRSMGAVAGDSDDEPRLRKRSAGKPKQSIFRRYVERQAEIELLLKKKWTEAHVPQQAHASMQQASSQALAPAEAHSSRGAAAAAHETPKQVVEPVPALFELAARTPNVILEGDILRTEKWSGGCMFRPPDERHFRLCLEPLDPLERNPIFFGIAPPNADLASVNFFDAGTGIFLCVGGHASGDLISALGAPGGPAFYSFGVRSWAELPPTLPSGQSLVVHYWEDEDSGTGQVRFVFSDEDGDGSRFAEPQLPQSIPPGWLPCILLCVPGMRIRVRHLY
mmetsp:Transcript_23372/g.59701  ORF Transcript_23372/g.59701 Transcript_23372/m.59701 type:complete len:553 (+) Transcript_23372:143-1801(+)